MQQGLPKGRAIGSGAEDARVLRSRQGLRQALLELLETRSLDQITIRDVAARADVGYTTYFRHYPSKEALLDDLAAEEIGRLTALVAPIYAAADSPAACLALCTYVDEHRALWTALLTGGASAVVREEFLRRGRETLAARGGTKGWLPGDLGLVLSVSTTAELLT
jgi:AcrR family transcriptional regulator